ncbi:MAG: hypothetical protein GC165_10880 [Armatimonadetes bacterium]|nr:hypothetical protein [Armatimonadota bacterium]MBS1728373.1 hypothetical protein [Armatimonadota bacterium]
MRVNENKGVINYKGTISGGIHVQNVSAEHSSSNEEAIDLKQLAEEIKQLRRSARLEASEVEHDHAVAELASAEKATREGDAPTALGHLKNAGQWALEVAEKIGVPLVLEVLKKSI